MNERILFICECGAMFSISSYIAQDVKFCCFCGQETVKEWKPEEDAESDASQQSGQSGRTF